MKRVAVLNQFALPRSEGGGTRHADLFERLSGWEPVIVAGNRNHYSQHRFTTSDAHFLLLPVPRSSGGALSRLIGWTAYSAMAFLRVLVLPSLSAVYGSSPHLLAPLAGLAVARIRRVPFVLEVRDLWPESIVAAGAMRAGSATHRVLATLERLLVRSADRVVVVTEGWDAHFAGLGVDPATAVTVIPNGTETADFAVSESREALREKLALDSFTAVFAGAHGPKDGIDLILDVAAEVPQVSFLMIGDGPSKAAAVRRAASEGLSNVRFMDPVPKAELPRVLRACDVGIHAVTPLEVFEKGMSPNKLFDYLAAGLPIVSNARLPLRQVVQDGEVGRIGGSHDLASCLRDVRDATEDRRAQWTKRAVGLVESRFSRTAAAERLEQLLDDARKARLS